MVLKNYQYPEIIWGLLRLELNFTFRLEHVTDRIVLGERLSSVAINKFDAVGEIFWKKKMLLSNKNEIVILKSHIESVVHSLQNMFQFLPLWICHYEDTFQQQMMQVEHWTRAASSCHEFYFTHCLYCEKRSFFKQDYNEMMPEALQSPPVNCGFYPTFTGYQVAKRVLNLTMLKYFSWEVVKSNMLVFSMYKIKLYNVFVITYLL